MAISGRNAGNERVKEVTEELPYTPTLRSTISNDPVKLDPNRSVEFGRTLSLDYTVNNDIDYYIQFNRYEYRRFLSRENAFSTTDGVNVSADNYIQKKLSTIRLPLISGVSHRYSGQYQNINANITYDALVTAAGGFSEGGSIADSIKRAGGEMSSGFINELLTKISAGSENKGILTNATGIAKNPREESSFVGMGNRSHTFDFLLIPRNESETNIIMDIIDEFKLAAHPENLDFLGANGFLGVPDEFTIGFFSKATNSKLKIPPIPDCFLTGIDITYNANNQARFYKNNTPMSYRISLSFTEVNTLTRNDIVAGGF